MNCIFKRISGYKENIIDHVVGFNNMIGESGLMFKKSPDDLVADFDYAPFSQQGGLGKAHQVFGDGLDKILEELNEVLVA